MHADAGNLPDHSAGFAAAAGEFQGHNTKAEPRTNKLALAFRDLSSSLSNSTPLDAWPSLGQGAARRATAAEHPSVPSDAPISTPKRSQSTLLFSAAPIDSEDCITLTWHSMI